jgi:hypothetical protein
MLPEDTYFNRFSDEELWQRYCGYLDLSVKEFMEIQHELLMDAVDRVGKSELGKKIMSGRRPEGLEEFQSMVPITCYNDYEPYLSERNEETLSEKPYTWCHSSGRGGKYKWIPHSHQCYEKATRNFIGSCILASARKKGEVRIRPNFKFLATLPPSPYASGSCMEFITNCFTFQSIPPPELVKDMEFTQKLQKGFELALRDGVDILGAIASVLVRMGQEFASQASKKKFSLSMLHPAVLSRVLKAVRRCKKEKRVMLPKDLWSPMGIVAGGMDTFIYKQDIARYWGTEPFDFYVSTETMFVAMQGWNKKSMTFIPDSVFFEFLPLSSFNDNREPHTKLKTFDELEEGELYEVIITQFHGMPLMRYRIGDIVKILSMEDSETGVRLPQIVIQRKVGDTIDLAGLATLDEKTIWQAISNAGIEYNDWIAFKEYEDGNSYLKIYLELREGRDPEEIQPMIHKHLEFIDEDYRDIDTYLKLQPVRVKTLLPGTFKSYMEKKMEEGADLAHLKPKHINPSQEDLQQLLICSRICEKESWVPNM